MTRAPTGRTTGMLGTAPLHVGILTGSAVVSVAIGIHTTRTSDGPGHRSFALFLGAIAVWTGAYGLGLLTTGHSLRITLESVAWIGRATVHVWFFLFVLAYTGYDRSRSRRMVVLLLLPAAAMIALVWTNASHGLVWATDPRVVTHDGFAVVVADVGPAYWLTVIYAYVLISTGSLLVLRLVVASDYLYADQSALLVLGVLAPFVASAVTVLPPHPVPGFDYTPYGFILTGVAFGYAQYRKRLFEYLPATRTLGRNAALARRDAGVLILDAEEQIIYGNDVAAALFDRVPDDLVHRDLGSILPGTGQTDVDGIERFERDDRAYRLERSPITDHRDRRIGSMVLLEDVTDESDREAELALLDDVNRVLRGVNRSLVAATSRADIERAVCEQVVRADVYDAARIGDVATWQGGADRWVDEPSEAECSPTRPDETDIDPELLAAGPGESLDTLEEAEGTWVMVPLSHDRRVFGALAVYTPRAQISGRERAMLEELGETVGYAIDSLETRQRLATDTVVAVELESRDPTAPFAAATDGGDGRVEVVAVSSASDGGEVAYLHVDGVEPAVIGERLETDREAGVRTIGDGDSAEALEWHLPDESLLGTITSDGAHLRAATSRDGIVSADVDVPTDESARALVNRVQDRYPDTTVVAKRHVEQPVDVEGLPADVDLDRLTDRQREVLEVAYRAGYFNWPRDSNAEEVADTLDISSPTLLHHLRHAQQRVVDDIFGSDDD